MNSILSTIWDVAKVIDIATRFVVSALWRRLAPTFAIMTFIFLMAITFQIGHRWRGILGISLQLLAGMLLVFDQLSKIKQIQEKTETLYKHPQFFSLLLIFGSFPFEISILYGFLTKLDTNIWSYAFGTVCLVGIILVSFLFSLVTLNKLIKKKNEGKLSLESGEKFDLSFKNVGILFAFSCLLTFVFVIFAGKLNAIHGLYIQMVLIFLIGIYAFFIFPLLMISPTAFIALSVVKLLSYVHDEKHKNPIIWFWISVFLLWMWGGLLLVFNEFKP